LNSNDLLENDIVFMGSGGRANVHRITKSSGKTPVCNLTISELHNFCAGEIKLLVHNASGTGDFLDRLQQANRQFGQNTRFRNWFHKVWKQDQGIPGVGETILTYLRKAS
jgi:hypothetical protein